MRFLFGPLFEAMRIAFTFFALLLMACRPAEPEVTRILASVSDPPLTVELGEHKLNLGGMLLVNRSVSWRDGTLYIPEAAGSGRALPLLV